MAAAIAVVINSKIVLCCKPLLWSISFSPHSNPVRPHFTEGKTKAGIDLSDLAKDMSPGLGACDDAITITVS